MFSKTCEYGLRAMIYIAQQSNEKNRVSLVDIAEKINSPAPFTAKILQQLVKNELIKSNKGPTGGFEIEETKLNLIKLSDIVNVLDGNSIYQGCGLGLKECNEKEPCPLHFKFAEIREKLKIMLESTTLMNLINDVDSINLGIKL